MRTKLLSEAGYEAESAENLQGFDRLLEASESVALAVPDIDGFTSDIWVRCERLNSRDAPILVLAAESPRAPARKRSPPAPAPRSKNPSARANSAKPSTPSSAVRTERGVPTAGVAGRDEVISSPAETCPVAMSRVECCLFNVDESAEARLDATGHDVDVAPCLQRCGTCQEDAFLVVDGDFRFAEDHADLLAGLPAPEGTE